MFSILSLSLSLFLSFSLFLTNQKIPKTNILFSLSLSLFSLSLSLFLIVLAGNDTVTCSRIQYFSGDDYIPDPNDSTGAIPCKYCSRTD